MTAPIGEAEGVWADARATAAERARMVERILEDRCADEVLKEEVTFCFDSRSLKMLCY